MQLRSLLRQVASREEEFCRSWPKGLQDVLAGYRRTCAPPARPGPHRRAAAANLPYWAVLPWLLWRQHAGDQDDRGFLCDAVWGQQCLFLLIRIQDDLFDGQASDLSLVFASDQFAIEAERVFSGHFARSSSFWDVFRTALTNTTRTILEVDRLQRCFEGPPDRLLAGYAAVASIFKVGTAAVCIRFGKQRDLRALGRFADEMAMAGQILDDLEDVADDWRRQRFNYVARVLLRSDGGPSELSRSERRLKGVVEDIYLGEGAETVMGLVKRHLTRAAAALEAVDFPGAHRYMKSSIDGLSELRAAFHRAQVRHFLGPLVGTRKARSRQERSCRAQSLSMFRSLDVVSSPGCVTRRARPRQGAAGRRARS